MPFRQAHEVVGAMVRRLLAEKRDFESLSLDEWQRDSDCSVRTSRITSPRRPR